MSKGILTVSLNAAVDVTYLVDEFAVGKINMVRELTRVAGGKANNVARVVASLGQRVTATGFASGAAGGFIQEDLRRNGIEADFEESSGENRTCISLVDPVGRTLTEVREKGPELTAEEADRFISRYIHLLDQAELVIISGSLPPGIPADYYRRLVSLAYRKAYIRSIVDASGQALKQVLAAQPYMVKPNLEELEEWAGTPLLTEAAILAAATRLTEAGPLVVGVSLGADGLLLVSPQGAWRAVPPAVDAVNTVGCGDSLVAGFAVGLMQGLSAEEILQLAVGCGTANALTRPVGEVRPADLQRLRPQVKVTRIA